MATSNGTTLAQNVRVTRAGIGELIVHRNLVDQHNATPKRGVVWVGNRRREVDLGDYQHNSAPYAIWRAQEHAFWNVRAWERLVSEYPIGGPANTARQWARSYREEGIRTELRPSGYVDLDGDGTPRSMFREVGPHSAYMVRLERSYHPTPTPSPLVHVTFPDWVDA